MSAYMDLTPAELADCLDMVGQFPGNTGALSQLDEATLAYGWRYATIGPPQRRLGAARHAYMRSYRPEAGDYAPEAWDAAVAAAGELAAALRPLGDATLPRCKRHGPCGTCNAVLDDDGQCRSSIGHDDADPSTLVPADPKENGRCDPMSSPRQWR